MWNEEEAYRTRREVDESSNPEESPKENAAESHTGEPVEELQKRQEQYEVWRSPFDFQKTLEYLTDGENQNQKKSLDMYVIDMGEHEAKMIGEAVASHPSLEVLTIVPDLVCEEGEKLPSPTSMWPMDSFLKVAFLGEKRNTSILSLFIAGSGTNGSFMRLGLLPQVLHENTHIRHLAIRWHGDDGTSQEELQDLFKAIQGNSTIQSLALPILTGLGDGVGFMDSNTFKQILKMVENNTSIQKLELHMGRVLSNDGLEDEIGFVKCFKEEADLDHLYQPDDDEKNLDDLYSALESNATIRILHLNGLFYKEIAYLAFCDWICTTETLRELHLDARYLGDAEVCEEEFLSMLFEALQSNNTVRKLKLARFHSVDDDDYFNDLLNAIERTSTLQEIEFDPPHDRAEEVREALNKGNAGMEQPESDGQY